MSSRSVMIIGGGLAGLSAGIALAELGFRVRIFEKRPFLGGRAASYLLPDGESVDNCQHVTFGCCSNLEDFYRRSGSLGKIRYFDRLTLVDPQGKRGVMRAVPGFPAPIHMPGFAFFPLLGLRDKLAIARAMKDIIRSGGVPADLATGEPISMLEWLRRRKQTPRAIERFWRAVLVSALSEELDATDAKYGVAVFWKAVLSNRGGYRMGVPGVTLSELYDGCLAAIKAKGGEVELRATARELRANGNAIEAAIFDGGRAESADAYILAVPHSAVSEILPEAILRCDPAFANLDNFKDAPITGVHLWFDRTVMTDPYLTVLDSATQWIFNKTALYATENSAPAPPPATPPRPAVNGPGQYLQIVISASHDLLAKPRQEIIDTCMREIRGILPATLDAKLLKATVVKETGAVFSPAPGCDRWRPGAKTSTRNLYLAGDWTATGWPATMEGAVRSGYLAAEAILADSGQPTTLVKPDLPVEWLCKLLARKRPTNR
jgi:squalene-associated FAD-dependent desaturase